MKLSLVILCVFTCLVVALPASAQLEPLPDQYAAFGVSLNPGAAPPIQGDVEWGKLLGANTYGGMAAGIIPSTKGTFSLTTAQAVVRNVVWRNNRVALVIDGKFGIANQGNGDTGGAFTGAGGAVFGLHKWASLGKLSAYLGVKAVKTSLQPNSFGPAVGLVFTPK